MLLDVADKVQMVVVAEAVVVVEELAASSYNVGFLSFLPALLT